MKRAIAMILVITDILLQGFTLNAQKKKDPVFTIILEQQGSASGESLQKYVTARYWPCTVWNSGYYGGLNFNEMEASGALVRDTPEGLLTLRGSLAGLKAGEVMLFYVSEKTGNGEAEGCLNELSTIGDGVFRTIIKQGDDVTTHITDPEHERYTKSLGPGSTMNALLKRTPEGALLTFSEPFLEGEGYCDYFGLFEGDNVPENIGQVFSFNLTNDDLRNWGALKRVNERTLNGPEGGQLHIKATLYGGAGPGYARVALDGCTQFGEGYQGKVTASGSPDGGSYEFRAEPSDLMTVEAQGPTALLTGSRRGRGTLYVRYTSPDGGVAESSEPVSVVALYSYNSDIPVPKIALYDAEGKKTSASVTVPYSAEPDDANELLDFLTGDPSLLNLTPSDGSLDLQGLKAGKTTIEAQDNCGNIIGPTLEVEVVNCDDETIERLEKMRKAKMDDLHAATRELQTIAGSEDFLKARDDLVAATSDLLLKVGLTIASGGKSSSSGVNTAIQIANDLVGLRDMLSSGSHEEYFINGAKVAVSKIGGATASTLVGLESVAEAAARFYEDIGEVTYHDDMLKNAWDNYEKAAKSLEEVIRMQQICKEGKQGPPKPTEPTPPPEPTPSGDPKPTKEPDKAEGTPPVEDPVPVKPEDPEPPVNPPPAGETWIVGLPYEPSDCTCGKEKSVSLNSKGLTDLHSGFLNLGNCVDQFNKTALKEYSNTLNELMVLTKSLEDAATGEPSMFVKKTLEVQPQLDSIILRVRAYDEAGNAFVGEFEKCPDSVKAGMDVLESALTVTIDSVKTKY